MENVSRGPRTACPRSSPRVEVPGRVVTDRPAPEVWLVVAAVAVLQHVLDRSRGLKDALTLTAVAELAGLGKERARAALREAADAGYLARRRKDGEPYAYRLTPAGPGEYVLYVDAYDFARPDVTARQRAAYLVLLAHIGPGGETRRLRNRQLAEFLRVCPRVAGQHAGSLEEGPAPLVERIDTTTGGRRWRLTHNQAWAKAGRNHLRQILLRNQRRNPQVVGGMLPDRPLAESAPLQATTTTVGGSTSSQGSTGRHRRSKRQGSVPRRLRALPRQHEGHQDRLDRLWELLDEDAANGVAPLGAVDRAADDLLRRFKLGMAADALLYVRVEVPKGAIHSPLALARAICRCCTRPASCPRRHEGPCGEARRRLLQARVRDFFLERDKQKRAAEASNPAGALAPVGEVIGGAVRLIAAGLGPAYVAEAEDWIADTLGPPAQPQAASFEEWAAAFRPQPGQRSVAALLEAAPRAWRGSEQAKWWADEQARKAVHRAVAEDTLKRRRAPSTAADRPLAESAPLQATTTTVGGSTSSQGSTGRHRRSKRQGLVPHPLKTPSAGHSEDRQLLVAGPTAAADRLPAPPGLTAGTQEPDDRTGPKRREAAVSAGPRPAAAAKTGGAT